MHTTSNEPLMGVTITLLLGEDNGNGKEIVKTSAAKGGFQIRSLPAGRYMVTASKAGYNAKSATLEVDIHENSNIEIKLEEANHSA